MRSGMKSWRLLDGLLTISIESHTAAFIVNELKNKIRSRLSIFNEKADIEDFEFTNRASRICIALLIDGSAVDLSLQDVAVLENITINSDSEELFTIINRSKPHLINDGGSSAIVSCDGAMKSIARIHNS